MSTTVKVRKSAARGRWLVFGAGGQPYSFRTWSEAIAFADRAARRHQWLARQTWGDGA